MQSKIDNLALAIDRRGLAILICLAALTVIIHLTTGGQYGFHRDELATLDDARHLAWGYVAYPPVTPFFARLSLEMFGTSLTGFRLFAALADAVAIVFAGLIARQLGGGRGAVLLTAAAATGFCLGAGTLMQYVSFDYLFWVLTAYFVAKVLRSNDPRWWIAVGCSIGLGMLTKYSILICVIGVVVGVLLTSSRRHLKSKWLWIGVLCSLLIFLPNFLWQLRHDFVSLQFLQHIHARDVRIGRTRDFLPDQISLNLLALPLAIAGLYFYFFNSNGRRFQLLGWMFVVPFALFWTMQGRGYYLAPAYPAVFAGGSVLVERMIATNDKGWRFVTSWVGLGVAMLVNTAVFAAFTLPIAPVNSVWWRRTVKVNGDLAEEIGWPELVEIVAGIWESIPPDERSRSAIFAANYGEAGAINLYGPRHGLPEAISGVNSFWERGYGDPPPDTVILLGFSREFAERHFESCELAARVQNKYGVANEESSEHPEIFRCRRLRESWPEFWKQIRHYG